MSQINSKNINELVSMLTSDVNFNNTAMNDDATSTMIPDNNLTLSATSIDQNGGNVAFSATSTVVPNTIELSATSVLNTQEGGNLSSTTDTEQLETQLRKLLGGGKRKSKRG